MKIIVKAKLDGKKYSFPLKEIKYGMKLKTIRLTAEKDSYPIKYIQFTWDGDTSPGFADWLTFDAWCNIIYENTIVLRNIKTIDGIDHLVLHVTDTVQYTKLKAGSKVIEFRLSKPNSKEKYTYINRVANTYHSLNDELAINPSLTKIKKRKKKNDSHTGTTFDSFLKEEKIKKIVKKSAKEKIAEDIATDITLEYLNKILKGVTKAKQRIKEKILKGDYNV